ncbi:MAG: XRE family transcriptional regulator [Blastocatellia bacterium]|nr:XRE family transcriptional regulator [Blastocatellia bacterium]
MNLQELRKRAGLTQGELARQLGVDASLLSRWERGEREPSFAQRMELARRLGVTVDYLAHGRLAAKFKFRAGRARDADGRRRIERAITEMEQQLHFIDEARTRANEPLRPFLLSVELRGQQVEAAATQIRDLLQLNRRVTFGELKQALTERNVFIFCWHLPAEMSGATYRGEFAAIFINARHDEERRLFTLAHEAAHLFCHLRSEDADRQTEVSIASNRDPLEKEANALAAELLMPAAEIQKYLDKAHGELKQPVLLDNAARFFNVSREAMFYRLTEFGLFNWSEKAAYFKKTGAKEAAPSVRVDDIADQVAPDFLRMGFALYIEGKISAGKLAEWLGCSRRKIDSYLSESDRKQEESGLLE